MIKRGFRACRGGRRGWRAALSALAVAVLPGVAAACVVQPVATLPLHLKAGHFVTSLRIEGSEVAVLVDTGAAVTALDRSVVDRLGLRKDPSRRAAIIGIGGRTRGALDFVVADKMALGALPLDAVPIVRGDFNAGRPEASRIEGILGGDILGRYDVEFDAPHERMVLATVAGCSGRFVDWPGAVQAIPLTSLFENRLKLAPLQLDGRPLTALIDTGATQSVVFAAGVRRLGGALRRSADDRSGYGIGADGGQRVKMTLHRFATMRLGAETTMDPIVAVTQARPMALDMVLGLDYLAKRRFWLSYATDQLFIAPP
jgi:predicted aspartyl protease